MTEAQALEHYRTIHPADPTGRKLCGPWTAGQQNAAGKARNALCIVHGGHSRTASVFLATERCNIARRALPTAR